VIVFTPSLREISPEAVPEVTVVLLTVIVAFPCVRVGVILIDDVELKTEAVYEVVELENIGERVPAERVSAESVAIFDIDNPLTVADPLA
jgi:hypothetical protein